MKARILAALGAVSASLICATALSAPANATVNPNADVNNEFLKSAAATSLCAVGNGSNVSLGACSATQTADLWSGPITTRGGLITNTRSGLCLTGDDITGAVGLNPCIKSAGQEWFVNDVGVGGRGFQDNGGLGDCLWQSVTSLQVRPCNFATTHDSWFYQAP